MPWRMISILSSKSGNSSFMRMSSLPGRSRAPSTRSGREVAASTKTPTRDSIPSSSAKNWFTTLSSQKFKFEVRKKRERESQSQKRERANAKGTKRKALGQWLPKRDRIGSILGCGRTNEPTYRSLLSSRVLSLGRSSQTRRKTASTGWRCWPFGRDPSPQPRWRRCTCSRARGPCNVTKRKTRGSSVQRTHRRENSFDERAHLDGDDPEIADLCRALDQKRLAASGRSVEERSGSQPEWALLHQVLVF